MKKTIDRFFLSIFGGFFCLYDSERSVLKGGERGDGIQEAFIHGAPTLTTALYQHANNQQINQQ